MYAWFYKGSHLLELPLVALVVFMIVFFAVVVHAWQTRGVSSQGPAMANLPLHDGDVSTGEHHV